MLSRIGLWVTNWTSIWVGNTERKRRMHLFLSKMITHWFKHHYLVKLELERMKRKRSQHNGKRSWVLQPNPVQRLVVGLIWCGRRYWLLSLAFSALEVNLILDFPCVWTLDWGFFRCVFDCLWLILLFFVNRAHSPLVVSSCGWMIQAW